MVLYEFTTQRIPWRAWLSVHEPGLFTATSIRGYGHTYYEGRRAIKLSGESTWSSAAGRGEFDGPTDCFQIDFPGRVRSTRTSPLLKRHSVVCRQGMEEGGPHPPDDEALLTDRSSTESARTQLPHFTLMHT